jgi:hypothetical protein
MRSYLLVESLAQTHFSRQKNLRITLTKMYWLLGLKSKLSKPNALSSEYSCKKQINNCNKNCIGFGQLASSMMSVVYVWFYLNINA